MRRILKTRKPAQQRYQDGDLKLEMRFQVQGFDRVLVVCRDLGDGATANDSGLYPQGASDMLPHRDGFEKSLRMALDMAALREDTVGRRRSSTSAATSPTSACSTPRSPIACSNPPPS